MNCHPVSYNMLIVDHGRVRAMYEPKTYGVDAIFSAICKALGVFKYQLKRNDRRQRVCDARKIAIHLIDKYHPEGNKQIAKFFNQDRTTVLHARKIFDNLYHTDPLFRAKYSLVERKLQEVSA